MSKDLSWLVGELRALAGDLDANTSRTPLVIAIDQGGHASRAIAYDIHGELQAETFVPITTFRAGKERVEHDANEVLESIRTALADLHQALGDQSDRVVASGLATQRSSIVCWETRTHKALSPILSWQDRRHAAQVERLRAHEPEIRARSGLPLSPHYGASKIRWCLDNLEPVRNAHQNKRLGAGPLAAWLLRALLDEHPNLIDAANAARTQLLDVGSRSWDPQLLAHFDVPREVLPKVTANRSSYGHLAFGDRRIPLLVCTGDQSAMPFAHGEPEVETIYLNIGTGAFLQRPTAQLVAAQPLLSGLLWVADESTAPLYSIEGTVNGAGSAIDWLNERIGIDITRGSPAWTHRAAIAVSRANVGDDVPLFMNGVSGVGSPYWRPHFESRFVGEGDDTARVIAVVESIAFLICVNIERMREGARRILASGGLAASDYLCECVAALSGLPVERTSLQESTAAGLAYLIANEPSNWHPPAQLERFECTTNTALAARFERWQQEMQSG